MRSHPGSSLQSNFAPGTRSKSHSNLRSTPRSKVATLPAVEAWAVAAALAATAVLFLLGASPLAAAPSTDYQQPPQSLVDLVNRPLTPQIRTSPDQRWLLLLEQPSLPSIVELAEPELRLGGLRFKPQNSGPSRRRPAAGLELLAIESGESRAISGLPEEPRLGDVSWSPDSSHIAFTHTLSDRIELWVVEVASAKARRLTDRPLNQVARIDPIWLSDSRSLICALIPAERGPAPEEAKIPSGPTTQENLGDTAPARTFQDLLKNAHDEAVFEHYLTSQLARIDLGGEVDMLGAPAMVWDYDPSPDGSYLLVETLQRPFSYLRPARWFPTRVDVWGRDGKLVRTIAELPLRENIPVGYGSVETGPRSYSWRNDVPATLTWVEALDGGDAGKEAELRDRLFLLPAPFDSEPVAWVSLPHRFGGVSWSSDNLALVWSWWWKTRNMRVLKAAPGKPDHPGEVLIDRSWEDRYNDPGTPIEVSNAMGRNVLLVGEDGKTLYLFGEGASEEGDRPFVDAYDLETRKAKRLFRSQAPYFERPIRLLDAAAGRLLTLRESVEAPPNLFLRQLGQDDGLRQLTEFPHPTPELLGLHKELIRYSRADGVELTATLYLPPGHKVEDGPLPMVMWAYPEEFKSADAASQVTDSPYRFDRISWFSSLLWLTQGYAVLDDPSMPIVGEDDEEPNDTFRKQLVMNAEAAVTESLRRKVTTKDQIAIGGHSYGAFMTANLLAHSDLFAAGIARSGAYNRTLTPFGFQSEERTLWEAPNVYLDMSPFMHAEKIDEPILLIHGEADNNSGTFPMQSERFYNALRGHGAIARLVMLPYESHGYRARESVLHMLWETHQWLERYVRKPAESEAPSVERGEAAQGRGTP
ncbi:MAG: prolyl oligopeptidase family serine peptidase [Acidobacteriota bacterium]